MEVTKEWLDNYIKTKPPGQVEFMLGRALVALYERQTYDEQVNDTTKLDNNIGFSACDAKSGSKAARAFLESGRLTIWQIKAWTRPTGRKGLPRICRYSRQLNEIAQQGDKETKQ